MKKNVSGQKIGAQMITASDGTAFTGSVTVYVTGDAGTQAAGSVGAGACTHEGEGYHTYAPAQAETNYDLIAFTFKGTGAINSTVQVFTSFPQTGDNYPVRVVASGTSDAGGSTTTMVDAARTEADTDYWKGAKLLFLSGSVAGQCSRVTAFTPGTDTLTFSPAVTQSVGAGVTYVLIPDSGDNATVAEIADEVRTELATELAVINTLPTRFGDLPGQVITYTMTESYAAPAVAPTLAQIIFETRALAAEKTVSGTTLTTKRLDGSTTAATYTLNSSTAPTAITRAT